MPEIILVMSQMLLVVPRIGHRLLFKVCFPINEHKNAIPQSNHSALVISFRIKNQQPKRFALFVYSFVSLVVFFLDFVFVLVFVLFFCCCFLVCLFASWSLRTDMRSSISMVTEPFSRVKSYSFVTPLTSI